MTRVEPNQTISTKNSKSTKHVSFKSEIEKSPSSKKLGGSMKTIEEEISGEFDKMKTPGSNKLH